MAVGSVVVGKAKGKRIVSKEEVGRSLRGVVKHTVVRLGRRWLHQVRLGTQGLVCAPVQVRLLV